MAVPHNQEGVANELVNLPQVHQRVLRQIRLALMVRVLLDNFTFNGGIVEALVLHVRIILLIELVFVFRMVGVIQLAQMIAVVYVMLLVTAALVLQIIV